MSLSLLLTNFIWPALSALILLIAGLVWISINISDSDIIHAQSIKGAGVRFILVVFPTISIPSWMINSSFIKMNEINIYHYSKQIVGGIILLILIWVVINVLKLTGLTIILWIRWNGAHALHFSVFDKKDLKSLKNRYHYLKNHIETTMTPNLPYSHFRYSDSKFTQKQLLELLTKIEKHLESANSVNNFYKSILNDENIGNNGINILEKIYDMPNIPTNRQIFRNSLDTLRQQDIENAIFYSQK